jgi:hypothetical protein
MQPIVRVSILRCPPDKFDEMRQMMIEDEKALRPGIDTMRGLLAFYVWCRRDDIVAYECKSVGRFGCGEAVGSIPADVGCGQTICRQRRNLRAADNELHDGLAAATCVKELRFVAIFLARTRSSAQCLNCRLIGVCSC